MKTVTVMCCHLSIDSDCGDFHVHYSIYENVLLIQRVLWNDDADGGGDEKEEEKECCC